MGAPTVEGALNERVLVLVCGVVPQLSEFELSHHGGAPWCVVQRINGATKKKACQLFCVALQLRHERTKETTRATAKVGRREVGAPRHVPAA